MAGLLAAITGVLVVIGWLLDIPLLRSVASGLVEMKVNTALGLVLLGVALMLDRSWPRVGRGMAGLAGCLGILTLGEYSLQCHLGIDELLFLDPSTPSEAFPGRMSPATAVSFFLIGLAIILLDSPRSLSGLAQPLALTVVVLCFAVMIGHAYGAELLYRFGFFIAVAVHTAVALFVLALGVLAARSDRGLMGLFLSRSAGGLVMRRQLPIVVLVLAVFGWLRSFGQDVGLYGTAMGTASLVTASVLVFGVMIVLTGRSLHRLDLRQRQSEALLADQAAILERLVRGAPLSEILLALTEVAVRQIGGQVVATVQLHDANAKEPTNVSESEREWSIPLLSSTGASLGTFAVTGSISRQPTAHDQRVIEVLARTAGVAVERRRNEDSLRDQSEQLKEADRRKDEFLATLAHELRNPLAPIRNGLQILRLKEADPSVTTVREMMQRQLDQLIRLVDDLLDVSRISRGKIALKCERVTLLGVLHSAIEACRPLIDQADHQLLIAMPPNPVYLLGDPARLAQVFTNLLSNSVKYTPRGGTISLSASVDDNCAIIRISDSGIGIPAAMLNRVFEMFVQVDRAIEKTTGGLGIGLSLVRGLLEMHGGSVTALSDGHDKGSTFVVSLPLSTQARSDPESLIPSSSPDGSFSCKVLIVDDNADAAESLGELLTIFGHQVSIAHDGEEGVEKARRFVPDLILLDLGMPRMNGFDACRLIRKLPGGSAITIVALTGWGQEEIRQQTTEAGFDQHLVKPVAPADLILVLERLKI